MPFEARVEVGAGRNRSVTPPLRNTRWSTFDSQNPHTCKIPQRLLANLTSSRLLCSLLSNVCVRKIPVGWDLSRRCKAEWVLKVQCQFLSTFIRFYWLKTPQFQFMLLFLYTRYERRLRPEFQIPGRVLSSTSYIGMCGTKGYGTFF